MGACSIQIFIVSAVGLIAASAAVAQPVPAQMTLQDIASVCAGIQNTKASGGRGEFDTASGYKVQVTPDKELTVTQSGQLLYKIDKFTYQDYTKCISDLAQLLSKTPIPEQKSCRDPSNGVQSYAREFDVTRESREMKGGYDQPSWCNDVINALRGEQAQGALFNIITSGETTRDDCPPLNCTLYKYKCTVHVKTDPIYYDMRNPACH